MRISDWSSDVCTSDLAGDVLGLDQMREDFLTFCAVEHAVEEVDILGLFGEEMINFEPPHEAVLEPRQFLQEDHGLAVPIAVEEGEAAFRLGRQRGLEVRKSIG